MFTQSPDPPPVDYLAIGHICYDLLPGGRAVGGAAAYGASVAEALGCRAGIVTSAAALESLKATDPAAVEACRATAGLSLGEYTALHFAGAMSFRDALQVVRRRGEAMQAAAVTAPSGMVSVLGLETPQVEEVVQSAQSAGTVRIAQCSVVCTTPSPACEWGSSDFGRYSIIAKSSTPHSSASSSVWPG